MDGYKWKGNFLKAFYANPAHDPLVKKRKQEFESGSEHKKPKTVAESLGHLSYEEQLETKQKKIEEILHKFKTDLRKANNIQRKQPEQSDDLICELRPILASPKLEGYRNKCEYTIGRTAEGDVMVGNRLSSYASGCLTVGSIEELKMPTDKMKTATKLLREFIIKSGYEPYDPETYQGIFRNLTIRQTRLNNGFMMIIGIHPQELTKEEKEKLQTDFVEYFTEGEGKVLNVTSIYYEEIQKRVTGQFGNPMKHIYGSTHINESLLGLNFRISANSFFQANSYAAEILYKVAIELAQVEKSTTVLDICCGTGTIGLCFAKYCKQVYGVEIIPEAIADAIVNAKTNGITNAQFTAGNADDLIFSCVKQANIEDGENVVAIVDPPRAGLQTKAIIQLRNSQKIKRLIYISCSPEQVLKVSFRRFLSILFSLTFFDSQNLVDLSKNCSKTMKGEPFVPKIAQAVDLFPHTPHCELVVLFERAEVEEEALPGMLEEEADLPNMLPSGFYDHQPEAEEL